MTQAVSTLNRLHEATSLLGQRCVAFHPRLVQLTGQVTAGLLLSQALYWTRKLADQPERQGWFWKTREDWHNETGLSRREQDGARRTLKDLGIWQEKRVGMPAKVWYRIDLPQLGRHLSPGTFMFYRSLSDITGAATAAVLLSNFLAQERVQARDGKSSGWRTYQFESLRQYLGFTRHELDSARSHLRDTQIVRERRVGVPPKVEWQVRLDRMIELLTAANHRPDTAQMVLRQSDQHAVKRMAVQFSGNVPSRLQESCKQECRNPANKNAGTLQTDFPETYQLDFEKRTNWNSGYVPTSWAHSGYTDGRIPENPNRFLTTGLKTTPPMGTSEHEYQPIVGGGGDATLFWPKTLTNTERDAARRLLANVPEHAQTLLDELAGQIHAGGTIKVPLNYLNAMVNRVIAGTFIPAAAFREQARREREAIERNRIQAERVEAGYDPQQRAVKHQAGLQALRTFMAERMGQKN